MKRKDQTFYSSNDSDTGKIPVIKPEPDLIPQKAPYPDIRETDEPQPDGSDYNGV